MTKRSVRIGDAVVEVESRAMAARRISQLTAPPICRRLLPVGLDGATYRLLMAHAPWREDGKHTWGVA
jgi:hypothetical protein